MIPTPTKPSGRSAIGSGAFFRDDADLASRKPGKDYYSVRANRLQSGGMPIHRPQMPGVKTEKPGGTAFRHEAVEFAFLPAGLVAKCDRLIRAYHGATGYWRLADTLWNKETRRFIAAHRHLQSALKRASTTRRARMANDCYLLIAGVILSLEVLASDFAGWGTRFPHAKRRADDIVAEFFPTSRTRLLDMYLRALSQLAPDVLQYERSGV
jgi:hypothetical protein